LGTLHLNVMRRQHDVMTSQPQFGKYIIAFGG